MYPGSVPYALSLFAISALTGGIASYAYRRPHRTGATIFGWLMGAVTEWSVFYAFELLAPTFPDKLFAGKAQYLGISAIGPLWLAFALTYTGRADWLTLRRKLLLAGLATLTFFLALTNESHHLIWIEIGLDPFGFPALLSRHGAWFWIYTVFTYILMGTGIVLYLIAFHRAAHLYRRQIGIMVIGSLIPLIGNAIYISRILPVKDLDLTPFAFAISGLLSLWGLFQFNLLDLTPIVAPVIIENLRDAVIIVDNSGRIVDLNPTAHQWLGVGDETIGQRALDVLKPSDIVRQYWDAVESQFQLEIGEGEHRRSLDIMISPLRDSRGKIMGRVVVARDNTREQALLMSEKRRARQMELLNVITNTALQMPDLHQALQVLADQLSLLLEADGTFITLWDDAEQRVIPATAYGEFRDTYSNAKIEPGENTLTASVLREGRPIPVEDVFNTPYMNPQLASDVPSRSVLGLPLIANSRKMGAALISFNQRHQFTTEEIAIGEQAAGQIALAVFKAHLLEVSLHQVDQLELLAEVGRQIANSLDEKEILEYTLEAVVDRFGYAEAAISLLVNDDNLEVAAISGTEDFGYLPGFQQKMGEGIIGHVARTRKHHVSGDVSRDPYYISNAERNGSALGVPMLDKDDLLGVIYIETTSQDDFQPDDIQTLQTLANQVATSLQKARLYARTQEHLQAITTLQSVSQVVTSSLELDETLHNVVGLLKETFGYTYISIYLLKDDMLHLGAQIGYPENMIIHDIPVTSGVTGRAVLTKQTQFIPDVSNDPSFLRASYEVKSEICVPFLKKDHVLGVLNVESKDQIPLGESDLNLLNALAGPIAIAIDNAHLHAQVKALAMTDAVSGLFNRHAFEELLTAEVQRAIRYGHHLSLIIFDLDSFKEYNDAWGHPAGDVRLRGIADLIRANQRKHDMAARYGGDEFAIILPNTDKEGAYQFAKRLLEAAQASTTEEPTDGRGVPGYTLSLGLATFPQDGDTLATLLLAADQAELMAKRLGKNRIISAGNSRHP